MLIDSHAHLCTRNYDKDRDEVLSRCRENGLLRYVEIGAVSGFEGNEQARQLAEAQEMIYFTVGLHPHDAKLLNPTDWSALETLATHPKAVGIGETGLDYFYDHSTPEQQRKAFVQSIGLARELNKPIVIHDREAHDEVMEILKAERAFEIPGEFHCFSGDWNLAERVIDMGWMVALGGVVTFRNATELHEVARRIPLDSLLLETDSPFLTPVPYRGKRNEPWMVKLVAERIAELKEISANDVIEATGRNAVTLFGLGLSDSID